MAKERLLIGACISAYNALTRKRSAPSPRGIDPHGGQQALAEEEPFGVVTDLYHEGKEVDRIIPNSVPVDQSRWSLNLLKLLEWKRFEEVCAGYFEALGFRSRIARAGADGGIDIHLYTDDQVKAGIIVQCKAWKSYKVGVKEIREFFGIMTADGVNEGVFITTGSYSAEAREFARGKNIHVIDGTDLLAKLASLPPEQQEALLELATAGDFTTPTCASCGTKMVQRKKGASGELFWGCPNFPRCRTTLQIGKRS